MEPTKTETVLPSEKELVTMTKDQLDELKKAIREEFEVRMAEAESQVDKLKLKYEERDAASYLERKGSDKGQRIKVSSPLGPPDRMDLIAKEHSGTLKGKKARFVTDRPEIVSLRRSQGYEPVRDKDKKEVRFMDGVLMAMPERKYQEEIAKPVEERKAINRSSAVEKFRGAAEGMGFEAEGVGIQYDKGD